MIRAPILLSIQTNNTLSKTVKEYYELLKESILDVLIALLEGQKPSSLVFDRIATTIDLTVLNLVMLPEGNGSIEKYFQEIKAILTVGDENPDGLESSLESKYLIFTLLLGI